MTFSSVARQIIGLIVKAAEMSDEPYKKCIEILGRSKGSNLIALGIYLTPIGALGIGIAKLFSLDASVPTIFFGFGVIAIFAGFALYLEESEKSGKRRSRRKKKKPDDD